MVVCRVFVCICVCICVGVVGMNEGVSGQERIVCPSNVSSSGSEYITWTLVKNDEIYGNNGIIAHMYLLGICWVCDI